MNESDFWKLVAPCGESESPHSVLETLLNPLSADQVVAFNLIFEKLMDNAYSWDLWGAAYVIAGGCSDDGFTDFRCALIAKGEATFKQALINPDDLADLGHQDEFSEEMFGYVAMSVYENKTGGSLPSSTIDFKQDPSGEDWDFDDDGEMQKRYPRLHKLYCS